MTPILTWSIVAMIVLASISVRVYWSNRFKRYTRVQTIRENFATSRRTAIHLLHDEQLKPESMSFGMMYLMSSRLVRRSGNYRSFSEEIIKSFVDTPLRGDAVALAKLRAEMATWTPDVREAWDKFFENIHLMVVGSVWEVRVLLWFERYFGIFSIAKTLARFGEKILNRINRDGALPISLDVVRTSRRTRKWVRSAAAA